MHYKKGGTICLTLLDLFRESKCGEKESYMKMVGRKEQYLNKCISQSNVDKDYNTLFNVYSSDLRVFLKRKRKIT